MTERAPLSVLSLGGSVALTGENDAAYLLKLALTLLEVARTRRLAVVVGGGRVARQYIQVGRELGLTDLELDELGIDVTRLNARLLADILYHDAPPRPPATLAEAVNEAGRRPILVMGGTEPGHTTDGVAALLAERLRAERLVNATRVPGIYDQDPATHPKARRLTRIAFADFRTMVLEGTEGKAGQEFIFDRLGVERLAKAKIPLHVVDGRDLAQVKAALLGRPFTGTTVEPAK